EGYIRLKPDRQPRVMADLVTKFVLPTARPSVIYGATDDYGVARLRILREVIAEDGARRQPLPPVEIPLVGPLASLQDAYALDLAALKLTKGDQLKLTLEAVDFRGSLEGKSSLSEPLVLQVTDKQGVFEAMLESDRKSDQQLDAIIRRQLGIGEAR